MKFTTFNTTPNQSKSYTRVLKLIHMCKSLIIQQNTVQINTDKNYCSVNVSRQYHYTCIKREIELQRRDVVYNLYYHTIVWGMGVFIGVHWYNSYILSNILAISCSWGSLVTWSLNTVVTWAEGSTSARNTCVDHTVLRRGRPRTWLLRNSWPPWTCWIYLDIRWMK